MIREDVHKYEKYDDGDYFKVKALHHVDVKLNSEYLDVANRQGFSKTLLGKN